METFVILGIIICACIVVGRIRSIKNDVDNDYSYPMPSVPTSEDEPPAMAQPPRVGRHFTLSELNQAQAGRYNWDESGCVFEINSDGSVTIAGYINPDELNADPARDLFDRMTEEGLLEMMPRMWSYAPKDHVGRDDYPCSMLVNNNTFLELTYEYHGLDAISEASVSTTSSDEQFSPIYRLLCQTGKGKIILLPSNEKEYILALGAQSCIHRLLNGEVSVKISSPWVMGAFGAAAQVNPADTQLSRISFAFGDEEDYRCCNMTVEGGVCDVNSLLTSSVIQPLPESYALPAIARGCLTQSLILEGHIKGRVLLDMNPYPMTLLHMVNGQVVKIYDLINPGVIPIRNVEKNISIEPGHTISFLIGSRELVDDIVAESGAPYGPADCSIEIDANMAVEVRLKTIGQTYTINIGELIG